VDKRFSNMLVPMLIGGQGTHKATFYRVRSDQYALLNRRASFIATTSAPRPLNDPTGSRRYLCCPVRRSSAWRRSTACSCSSARATWC
jgi:predicted P-loop ATPase